MLIVTYHAIADRPSPVSSTAAALERDLRGLQDAGFSCVPLAACERWLRGAGSLPDAAVAVTFDDGYESVLIEAVPILQRFGVPATVFIVAGRLGQTNRWPKQWGIIPEMRLVTEAQVRELCEAGISIGAHSWSHASLPELSDSDLRLELEGARDRLEQITGVPVSHLAYPYGRCGERERTRAAASYALAVSTRPRAVARTDSRFDVPRIDAHDLRVGLRLGLLGGALGPSYLAVRRTLRRVRRLFEAGNRPSPTVR